MLTKDSDEESWMATVVGVVGFCARRVFSPVSLRPWVNVANVVAAYPWRRFLLWDVLGELLWVLYVSIGYAFSNRVQAIAEIFGNLTWVIVAFIVYRRGDSWLAVSAICPLEAGT